jgi:esterase/lipase superfamily enzyme
MVRTFVIAVMALVLAGCAIDDSGPVRSLFRPADGSPVLSEVVYVTDREPDDKAPGGYALRWAGKPSCGTAQTQIPAALVAGEEQKWGYVERSSPTTCSKGKMRLGGAIALIEAQAKARHCRSVFLFVHGFHTGFDGGVLRAAQLAHDAQTGCAVAAFSWSAEIDVDRYVSDLEHSDFSQPLLAEFLRELSESGLRVTVAAHSLGARLTLMTLSGLGQDREPPRTGFVDELVLAAGDIGIDPKNNDFLKLMAGAAPFAKRTTIYVSAYDTILEISRREHGGVPRLGISPDLAFKADDATHVVDIVDASMAAADRLDHSYYAMSHATIADMTLALNGVSIETRLKGTDKWPATLKCAGTCPPNYRINTEDGPHFITRMILNVLPIVPLVR